MDQQNKKVALITGAARRIGATLAKQLHEAGYRILIHAHRAKQEATELQDHLNHLRPNSAHVYFADLQDTHAPAVLIDETLNWAGRLDCLVHNASQFIQTEDAASAATAWHRLFSVNVEAPYFLSHAAAPHLAKQNGEIIYITDIHAFSSLKGYDVYCQTKAALTMQMLAFAKALAPKVRVNAVAPGAIMWPEAENTLAAQTKKQIIAATPLQKHGHPDYIAQAVLTLIQNPFITGQTLKVDGGRSLV
jgi:pteridine reductase